MTNYVYIATSLDGFIATADGGLDWLDEIPNPEQSDFGYGDFIRNIDAIVMGRNSFEKVLTFDTWPYDKQVIVLSKSLGSVPNNLASPVEIVRGNLKQLVNRLHGQGYNNLYIDGGGTIQSFLAEDMIDEITITRIPVLLGGGIPLFGSLTKELRFSHVKTELFNNALVKSTYTRMRA